MAKRVLILGGGAGGLLVAYRLWRELKRDEAQITVVDRSSRHVFLPSLPWVATGYRTLDDVSVELKALEARRGIKFVNATVMEVKAGDRTVVTDKGKLEYDLLVVALGAEPNYNAVPGLENTLAPWTPERAEALRNALARMRQGTVITGFVNPPFPCPPAPYEIAAQVSVALKPRVNGKARVKVVVPEPKPLYAISPSISDAILESLERADVEFIGGVTYDSIDTRSRTIITSTGERIKYDILAVTPPYRPVKAVADSELAGAGGWLAVDPTRSFRSRKYDDVFGVGDIVAPALNLPMAGAIAHAEAEIVASAIIEELRGVTLSPGFKLYAACAMDLGQTGLLVFCDFTPMMSAKGPMYCSRVIESPLAKLAKELFEVYWFTKIAPKG